MKSMVVVVLVLLVASQGQAQTTWTKTCGGTSADEGHAVQQTADGGYIVAGYTRSYGVGGTDVYLIKTNASGDTLWTRTYGGTGNEQGVSVRQTPDGGFVVAGYTNSFGAGLNDAYLIKTNASGDTLWTRTYGGASGEYGGSVEQTSDGGYVVAGYTNSFGAGRNDVYVVKANASGDTLWTRTYGGTGTDIGYSILETEDEGFTITGETQLSESVDADVWLIRTDDSGDTLWTKTYGGTGADAGYSVQQTSGGGYVIAGSVDTSSAGNSDVYLIKTNASGDTIWTRIYGGRHDDKGYSVQQTTDGGYIIAGWTDSSSAGSPDAYLIKANASGDTLWTRTHGGPSYDWGQSVRQTPDGGYIVVGETQSFGAGSWDIYLVKADSNGNVGVEEPAGDGHEAAGSVEVTPNPFSFFARIPGHEAECFDLFDVSGKMVGTCRGNRVGEGLPPMVYFVRLDGGHGGCLRIVKAR